MWNVQHLLLVDPQLRVKGTPPFIVSLYDVADIKSRTILQSNHNMEPVTGSVLCIVCGMRGPSSQTGSQFCKRCRICATCCGYQQQCTGVPFKLSDGRLYCGRQGLYSCRSCDGQCGPENGCQCPDCFKTSQRVGHTPYSHQAKARAATAVAKVWSVPAAILSMA